jgi:hypothetical protein
VSSGDEGPANLNLAPARVEETEARGTDEPAIALTDCDESASRPERIIEPVSKHRQFRSILRRMLLSKEWICSDRIERGEVVTVQGTKLNQWTRQHGLAIERHRHSFP